jgi:fermentation-respiration switch protein FrsA (DUF1100 family)
MLFQAFKFIGLLMALLLACCGCEHSKPSSRAPEPAGALDSRPDIPTSAAGAITASAQASDSAERGADRVGEVVPTKTSRSKRPTSQSLDELLLFFPTKYPDGNWEPHGLNFADVWFTAGDGTRLHGWYCPCENPRAVLLIAHGNAGNLSHRAALMQVLQSKMRVSAFIFDYRGYGRSEGVPTVEGALADARAARAALAERAGINESDVTLLGESLGGAIAVQLAAEKPTRGLVLERTFSSLKDIASHHYRALAWLVPAGKLNSAAQIARYKGPLLQCHGDADQTIPISSGSKLFQAANEPKQFVKLANVGHNDPLPAQYLMELDAFLEKLPRN